MASPIFRRGLDRFKQVRQQMSQSFYSAEAKHRLAEDHVPLYLHNARLDTDNQFGPRWLLTVSEDTETADRAYLGFSCNDWRDKFFGELAGDLSQGPIGPLQLVRIRTKGGQEAWDLTEWEPF